MENLKYLPYVIGLFVALIFFLNIFFFRPILEIVNERKKRVSNMKQESREHRIQAEKLDQEFNQELNTEKKKTGELYEFKKKEVLKKNEEKINEARNTATKVVGEAKKRSEEEYCLSKEALKKDTRELTEEILKKLVPFSISTTSHSNNASSVSARE
ncbi:MAG: hypothetical protein HYW47_02925 [Deltaproteobacteria bacterium]|nr:hypothetical protein [Deltaproteobacteria bacterium]